MMKILGVVLIIITGLVVLSFMFSEGPRLLFGQFDAFEGSSLPRTETQQSQNKGFLKDIDNNNQTVLSSDNNSSSNSNNNKESQAFKSSGLKTNTAKASIDLKEILDGGPGKDGIPAIDEPKFISTRTALENANTSDLNGFGIAVENSGYAKFYPYNILVWHEIVNDYLNSSPILVTFCPLCGSAIVFDPKVDGRARTFGVSGKLWESNLLMYDRTNESLWSQIIGKSIVGNDLDKKLDVIDSNIMTLRDFGEKYKTGKVLSEDTGYSRNYDFYPYGDYDESRNLVFPVSVNFEKFHPKTLMHIVNVEEESVAFVREDLLAEGEVTIKVNDDISLRAYVTDNESTIVIEDQDGDKIPGYTAMWFSWAVHNQENGTVWSN